jgi:hypothetical protein
MNGEFPLVFVNFNGDHVATPDVFAKPLPLPKKEALSVYHKGWIVEGVPPGSLAIAKEVHERERRAGVKVKKKGKTGEANQDMPEWDEQRFLRSCKLKRVRTKAYGIEASARDLLALAAAQGWLVLRVRALSKGEVSE